MIDSINLLIMTTKASFENWSWLVTNFAATCKPGQSFIGLPTWYKYLDGEGSGLECTPVITGLPDIWLVVLAIVELLIRVAALASLTYVVIGGIKYMIARGNPDKLTTARMTIIYALVGLVIAVVAVAVINFAGNSFKES